MGSPARQLGGLGEQPRAAERGISVKRRGPIASRARDAVRRRGALANGPVAGSGPSALAGGDPPPVANPGARATGDPPRAADPGARPVIEPPLLTAPDGEALLRQPGPGARSRGARAVYGAVILAAVLIVAGLVVQQLITLLLAVMLTVIVSLPLSWCADKLGRLGVPRALGALAGLIAGFAIWAAVFYLLVPPLIDQARTLIKGAPAFVHAAEVQAAHLVGATPGKLANQLQSDVTRFVRDPSGLVGPIASIGLSAAAAVAGIVIGIITAFYMAARPAPLVNGLLSLFTETSRPAAARTLERIRSSWMGWLRGLAISMLLIGALLYGALALIVGLPFALVFAVISAIAEAVPYLGALASGVPPVAFALTISPTTALWVLLIYIAVHQVEANLIGPLVMSRAVRLHPAVIAFGVVAVGEVFGFLGLIVAVPILTLVAILIDELWVRPREAAR